MPYNFLETQSPEEMTDHLNGVISTRAIRGRFDGTQDRSPLLGGLTLVFTVPIVTVTFGADPIAILDVAAQLNTQVQAVDANFFAIISRSQEAPATLNPMRYVLKMRTGTAAGLTINLATSTAAAALGLPSTGTLHRAPVVSTKIVAMGDRVSGSLYIITAE